MYFSFCAFTSIAKHLSSRKANTDTQYRSSDDLKIIQNVDFLDDNNIFRIRVIFIFRLYALVQYASRSPFPEKKHLVKVKMGGTSRYMYHYIIEILSTILVEDQFINISYLTCCITLYFYDTIVQYTPITCTHTIFLIVNTGLTFDRNSFKSFCAHEYQGQYQLSPSS